MLSERAFAKLNLVLHVGRPRGDGLHPLCSVFASLDLADEVTLEAGDGPGPDRVDCPGVEGPNLALAAVAAVRGRVESGLPAVRVVITKRIPVAAGLGGGSADAAAVLRLANRLAGAPLDPGDLRELAVGLGSDVPSQVVPGHALVQGAGEVVEPLGLPPLGVVLVPGREGLSTGSVYAELDRQDGGREGLDPEPLRRLAAEGDPEAVARGLDNDLEPAALTLRPELAGTLARIRAAGALGAAVSGSGPTCFGLFADRRAAEQAAATPALLGALVSELRAG